MDVDALVALGAAASSKGEILGDLDGMEMDVCVVQVRLASP